ncbi:tyrosine-type recombinase/integrase [Breoghania sp.]|uniref:tyrosine-type recombinase/integrase n=1 Tax=Breoghania sp. TaxID=2065378 RepID=UPI002AA657CB|nr:tyrosine-type recombinase/integrase [Breoghania sp.]
MLTDTKLRKIKPGHKPLTDTQAKGLHFFPTATAGTGKWIFRFKSPETTKRRDMGLGSYPITGLQDARDLASAARRLLEAGKDSIEERARTVENEKHKLIVPTFEEAARRVFGNLKPGFRNDKHIQQWISSLEAHVFPVIGRVPVPHLAPADFARVLQPIWLKKPETASRVKQRCDVVMKWCAANGFIVASPLSVVTQLLPRQPGLRERVVHQPAMRWQDVPSFVRDVLHAGRLARSKVILEVLILTACRSGEVRGMRREELDLDQGIWPLPSEPMKAKVAHRVPLSPYLVQLLERSLTAVDQAETSLVFPTTKNTPISDMTLTKALRDHKAQSDIPSRIATAHGFRSTFRDWASEHRYPRDLAERALAHTIKNATEAANHRTDLLKQRREMMLEWENWVMGR